MYKTQKKSSTTEPPRTATHCHKFPTNSRVSHSSLRKSKKNFTKPMPPLDPSTSNLQNLGKSTPKVRDLCKSAHNFRKLTIPWSSMALDRQNPKKFETKKAVTRRHAPLMTPVFAASTNTCSHVPPVSLTRLHAPGLSPRAARHTRAL